jgi:hypothetical protein
LVRLFSKYFEQVKAYSVLHDNIVLIRNAEEILAEDVEQLPKKISEIIKLLNTSTIETIPLGRDKVLERKTHKIFVPRFIVKDEKFLEKGLCLEHKMILDLAPNITNVGTLLYNTFVNWQIRTFHDDLKDG